MGRWSEKEREIEQERERYIYIKRKRERERQYMEYMGKLTYTKVWHERCEIHMSWRE